MKSPSYQFAARTRRMSASIIREILKVSSRPNVTSFAGGLPAPETFPLKAFEQAMSEALKKDGQRALQYTVTEGYRPLKEFLCGWLKKQGIHTTPEEMLMTHGSQQGLDLLGRIFISPGDSVLVEDPSYLGAIQCFNSYEATYATVPIDEEGLHPRDVRDTLDRHDVKFIYTVPTFQNPTGITMSLKRRMALLEVAAEKGLPIVEDDPYGLLRFSGEPVPSLYSLARGKGVIYLSTFSKLLSPGIRLGFMLAEKEIIRQLILAKQASDLQCNTLIQYAVYHYCRKGHLDRHLPTIIRSYGHKAGVMLDAIRKYFPPEVECVKPDGGMFIWCRLPKGIKASDIFKKAIRRNVAFVDGSVFYANGGGENTLRLNFTNSSDQAMRSGIERLGKVIRASL